MKKEDSVYLLHMRDAIQRILNYTKEGRESFFADSKTQDAVVRNLEIIGEASKNISQSLKATYPDVSWKQIIGMRDKVIHEYFGVNLKIVWDTIEGEIPELKRKIETILENLSMSL